MIDIELHVGDMETEPDDDTTAHVLGIVNESLSNVARHSGATSATVFVESNRRGRTQRWSSRTMATASTRRPQ